MHEVKELVPVVLDGTSTWKLKSSGQGLDGHEGHDPRAKVFGDPGGGARRLADGSERIGGVVLWQVAQSIKEQLSHVVASHGEERTDPFPACCVGSVGSWGLHCSGLGE